MRAFSAALTSALALGLGLGLAGPALAHGDHHLDPERRALLGAPGVPGASMSSPNVSHLSANPSQVGISGCFLKTAPLLVTSGLDSVRVWDVSDAASPEQVGVLPSAQFENEAMNCGERRTRQGTRRFALIGLDLYQASPDDIQHVNVGGDELVIVEVTDPTAPTIISRVPGTTSTHTVACIEETDCRYAYSAGSGNRFSIFDLRNLRRPREVDAKPNQEGIQSFWSPTAGHKWNFDAAGIGTHTGWKGASMWRTGNPTKPRLITTTGRAGRGADPDHPGWNDFILHNAFRPNAQAFQPNRRPSVANGNVLFVTEEDYEQTDCTRAGSFQSWWVKRLDGTRSAIVPLDKVELADLGSYPLPQGAFCSSHWFDVRPDGIIAAGFYGGGTQLIDGRKPRKLRSYGYAVAGASEVWDSMWVPVYNRRGRQTGATSNILYSIDLVRGLDAYAVDVPGDRRGALPTTGSGSSVDTGFTTAGGVLPIGLLGGAGAAALALRRRVRRTTSED